MCSSLPLSTGTSLYSFFRISRLCLQSLWRAWAIAKASTMVTGFMKLGWGWTPLLFLKSAYHRTSPSCRPYMFSLSKSEQPLRQMSSCWSEEKTHTHNVQLLFVYFFAHWSVHLLICFLCLFVCCWVLTVSKQQVYCNWCEEFWMWQRHETETHRQLKH